MGFTQYLKDTRGELHHVAWPTRTDTIVYTVLVALVSVGIALYLGFFDYLFTSGLGRALNISASNAQNPIQVTNVQPATTTAATSTTSTPAAEEENSTPLIDTN